MSQIPCTICRSGTYYYNRRVPKHAVKAYGPFIRQSLSRCPEEASEYAFTINTVLESFWKSRIGVPAINVPTIIESFGPKASLLSDMAEEYLSLRQIDHITFRVAVNIFISLAGDRDVGEYSGEDAKLLVRHLALRGNKTATIRRINSLSVILNYAYAELDLAKSNPFTRLIVRNEGNDFSKRGTFNCSTRSNSDRPTMTKGLYFKA